VEDEVERLRVKHLLKYCADRRTLQVARGADTQLAAGTVLSRPGLYAKVVTLRPRRAFLWTNGLRRGS
jgi:hypothetical protein